MKNTTARTQAPVLSVKGELDSETFPKLLRQAEACFDQGQVNLIIDLHDADSITEGGMIALQTIIARSTALGGKTVLTGLTGQTGNWIGLTESKEIRRLPRYSSSPSQFGAGL